MPADNPPDGFRAGGPFRLPDTTEDWWEDDDEDVDDDIPFEWDPISYSEYDTTEYDPD